MELVSYWQICRHLKECGRKDGMVTGISRIHFKYKQVHHSMQTLFRMAGYVPGTNLVLHGVAEELKEDGHPYHLLLP